MPRVRRATAREGHLAVGDGVLGKVVVNNQGVLPLIPEIFADAQPA